MSNRLSRLVKTIVGSLPVENPHPEKRQQGRIIDFRTVHHSEPFSPSNHVRPQVVIKEEVREDVIPPMMVCSRLILPLQANPVEGDLGDLENSPLSISTNQKQRGKLPCESLGNVPTQTTGYEPSCQNTEYPQGANPWSAG